MAEMCVQMSYGNIIHVEICCEDGWNPDVAEDMVTRCGNAFMWALSGAAQHGLLSGGTSLLETRDDDGNPFGFEL